MEDKELLEMNIADTIIERQIGFNVGKQRFCIYPPTLGKTYLLARLLKGLEANEKIIYTNPYLEAMRLCTEKKDVVCRVLAYNTFNRKEDILDNRKVDKRTEAFSKLDVEELATLFTLVLSDDNTESYISYFGIDKERVERARIAKIKNDSSSVTFGGNSTYGTLIDFACQRYGWSMDYVVWGISYANLKMLMADAITTIYLSEEERKQLGMSVGEVINGDDPKNKNLIRQMLNE
ncbi:hypothetical protein [Bacteroides sp.]|uniref:hypothetical protein n=1 Tax=Bacteroides sp. TaxID=29523 RepID=UPI002613688F|nr:hypothetical protein [Bacteroides sp.]